MYPNDKNALSEMISIPCKIGRTRLFFVAAKNPLYKPFVYF